MRTKHLYPLCLLVLLAACLGMSLNSCTNDLPELEQLTPPGTDTDTPLRPEDYVGRPVSFSGFTVTEVTTDAATRAVTGSSTAPFGKEGDVVTIRMDVQDVGGMLPSYFADYVLSQDGTLKPVSAPQNDTLRWQGVGYEHWFTAYYPALTAQEKIGGGRTDISLPLTWTEDNYREHGRLMQSPRVKFGIGSIGLPVSLNLQPLLTRIEVTIDPATGTTDATHLTMYTKTMGVIRGDATVVISGNAGNVVQPMHLWRDTSSAGTPSAGAPSAGAPSAGPNPVFRGYAIPQTYALGTLLLKHHTPDVNDARNYTVDLNPSYPAGLETKGGEVVRFAVAAIPAMTVHVPKAGELKTVLDAYIADHGNYLMRLKITGELDWVDLNYLAKQLTKPGGPGGNIIAVDMGEASVEAGAFDGSGGGAPFYGYTGSIKRLVLPSSLSTVPFMAFCVSTLTSITLPEGLREIGESAFEACKDLKSITLPSSVTTLGMYAFAYSGLTSIVLPEALKDVGIGAFSGCTDLQHVALPGNEHINVDAYAFFDIPSSCRLFLYAPELDTTSPVTEAYLSGTWGGTPWAYVHWGYKGTGSKLDPENYEHHLKK